MNIKIDLITGFLGSGKTTFIRKYVEYLIKCGERVGILENDYGAINVDMMLLSDLRGPSCEIEMIAGGCCYDCHVRRFKTKLISMAMSGYTRVIVEPSGIFDTDEFFDLVYDEPLDNWYEIGSVITSVDSGIEIKDKDTEYLFASQLANAGAIIFSKVKDYTKESLIAKVNKSLEAIGCNRRILVDETYMGHHAKLSNAEFDAIKNSGYHSYSYEKRMVILDNDYSSLFLMNKNLEEAALINLSNILFNNKEYGDIIRIKGFFKKSDYWYLMNMTKDSKDIDFISSGQDVIIIIGKDMNEEKIEELISK
jgi:G3E family GTPase